MNRLKFNEGGQPVYLDDLETLQANAMADTAALAKALAQDTAAFLLRPLRTAQKEAGAAAYTVKGGSAMINGEMVSWDDTEVSLGEATDPVYLCVKRTESDSRTFEDGQSRACATSVEAWMAASASGAAEWYNARELPDMAGLLRTALGIKDEPEWRDAKGVTFQNGYSGTVAIKETDDTYRVKIDIKSVQGSAVTGYPLLFLTTEPCLQTFVSSAEACVDIDNKMYHFMVTGYDGQVTADVSLPFDNVSTVTGLDVKMIFDLPKF